MSARIVIAAPCSGQGKTTVALGLVGALRRRGLRTAAAKVGPDYLDTGWHQLASGAPVRNLDLWMMGVEGVQRSFATAARDADAIVIEGVMGLFDGHRTGAESTSTADVAALLGAPVLLVLDASSSAATLAAIASGLARFDDRIKVIGVVLNRFREGRERCAILTAFAQAELPVIGWVPPAEGVAIPSRHLGLTLAEETLAGEELVSRAADLAECYIDIDRVLAAMREAPELALPGDVELAPAAEPVRIGVARDEAFAFYYPDNFDALEAFGGEVVEFSPLTDSSLPADIGGLYLGGGYPELHAERLSANGAMRRAVAEAAKAGMPIYAECGGMLYLLDELADVHGHAWPMAGVVSARARMTPRLQRVGYVEAALTADCILGDEGTCVRGHEFRYSECDPLAGEAAAWTVGDEPSGFSVGNIVASYLHVHFAGAPNLASAFVDACRSYAESSTASATSNLATLRRDS